MKQQHYHNHKQVPKDFFLGWAPFALLFLLISTANLVRVILIHGDWISALSVLGCSICVSWLAWFARSFSIKVQDRAIRAEENLRFYVLKGKLLPKKLRLSQIIALRFASDDEFAELVERAEREDLRSEEIKKLIRNWKGDHHRV
jgi:hypothetical protein